MILKRIEWRNFKSYSNIPTTIEFDSKNSVNLIVGDNGTGKSSIEEVIKYTLYGKLDGFTNSDIPNRINRNFYAKIDLTCKGHEITIERGLSPTIFEVIIDGERVDMAGKNNVQDMLEESYFDMSSNVFNNTLVLSVRTFKSLIDLNASDKRNIIDKILGFDVINLLVKQIKDEYKNLTKTIDTNKGYILSTVNNKKKYESEIKRIKETGITQEELDEIQEQILEMEKIYGEKMNLIEKLQKTGLELKETLSEKKGQLMEFKMKIDSLNEKIDLIDMGKCPICGSSLETDEHKHQRDELVKERDELQSKFDEMKRLGQQIVKKLDLLSKKEDGFRDDIRKLNINELRNDLKVKSSIKDKDVTPLIRLKNDISNELKNLKTEYESLMDEEKTLNTLMIIFGDNGLKKTLMSKYIPIINTMMSDTLKFMGLTYEVEFDDSFNSKITQNGYNIKYSTLSTGEKIKIDFACVITMIKFMKLQHGDLNVLFLDELFSNVDINGVSYMIDILKDISNELNMNVFLIHHAQLEGILFDKIYHTYKPDGFSRLELVEN